jgi:hypothetical protein
MVALNRATLGALICSVLVYAFWYLVRGGYWRLKIHLLGTSLILLAVFVPLVIFKSGIKTSELSKGIEMRAARVKHVLRFAMETPLLGSGFHPLSSSVDTFIYSGQIIEFSSAHNDLTDILARGGFVFLGMYTICLTFMLRNYLKHAHIDFFAGISFIIILLLVLYSIFQNMYKYGPTAFFIWFLMGTMYASTKKKCSIDFISTG